MNIFSLPFTARSTTHLHTYRHQPPPLARIREVGWFYPCFARGGHYTTTPSCSPMRDGWFFVHFTRNGHYITTATPSRLQMRGGGHSVLIPSGMAATSRPTPFACKREVGVVLQQFCSVQPPRHDHHPLSFANVRWGLFSIRFARCSCHPLSFANAR